MKNILVLNGSPKGEKGNTSLLVEAFLEGFQEQDKDAIIKRVVLNKSDVHNCVGCFNCWTKTPGECIYSDDMPELIEAYLEADTVIWATPLYHHGMTSIMKKFIERTLPFNEPYIVKEDGCYTHPERFSIKGKKNILISNCGFPERHNFDIMRQTFERITHHAVSEEILCVMGELLSKKPLRGKIGWYFDAVKRAGMEYAQQGEISSTVKESLEKPLVSIEDFIEMANLSWEAEGEQPPELDQALRGQLSVGTASVTKSQKGLSYMKLMKHSFIGDNADGVDAILAFDFTDLNESHHFRIKDNKCQVVEGESETFTTKIVTSYDTWLEISNGELSGSKAMMDGLYKVKGDLDLMMAMNKLFGSETASESGEESVSTKKSILGIKLEKWMSLSFAPWIMSWICISFSAVLGIVVPFIVTAVILAVKKTNNEVTYFEKISAMYFTIITIMWAFGLPMVGTSGTIINYFAMAVIWASSLVDSQPLTSDYSKHQYEGNMTNNAMFIKTNMILTLFWSVIFIIQGCAYILLRSMGQLAFAPALYILIIAALMFTGWFSGWYPKYIASGQMR